MNNQSGQLAKIIERSGADASTNTCDGDAALVGPPSGPLTVGVGWAPRLFRLAAKGAPVALALALFAWVICLLPGRRELRRLLIEFYLRGGWRLRDIGTRPVRRLRLPSMFWRAATLVVIAALIADDPAFQGLSTARACSIPANGSTETTRITEFAYDLNGHLAQVNCPEGVINYEYDLATGRLIHLCTANSEVAYGYDALGRLQTVHVLERNAASVDETTTCCCAASTSTPNASGWKWR